MESRLPVGSSARMMEGLLTRARAMATRWRWPPESSLGLWFMRDSRPTSVEGFLGARDARGGGGAVVDQRQLDVVQRGGAGQQIEGLEDEADLLVADARQLVVVQLADQLAVEPVLALGGRIEAADQVHQRGLAGAGGAHDGDVLVVLDAQRDAAQGLHLLLRAHIVGAPQILDDDDVAAGDGRGLRQFFGDRCCSKPSESHPLSRFILCLADPLPT